MAKEETFSKRLGHFSIKEKEITVREDAPVGLRNYLRIAFYDLGKNPSDFLPIICKILKVAPEGNWTEFPNIDYEIKSHLENCDWFYIYDIIELTIGKLNPSEAEKFCQEINEYFLINGIGWKIVNGQIEIRGDEVFETAIKKVEHVLQSANLQTAKSEIQEAILDLSRRPHPDVTGAIQHSLACLECVCREVVGDKKATLGELIKRNSGVVPRPLDNAIEKIWGYSSEQGRHLREGQVPDYLEAELVVEVTAAIATYLGKKHSAAKKDEISDFDF